MGVINNYTLFYSAGIMCIHSSMKLLDQVVNDKIHFIKPDMKLKICDLCRGDSYHCNTSLDGRIHLLQVYVNIWPQLYVQLQA